MRLLFLLLSLAAAGEPVVREDFREVPAHIPATSDDLTSSFLSLERLGPGAANVKLSFHPEVPNDPHYLWNGLCEGPVLLAFPFQHALDLSDPEAKVVLQSKNFGRSTLHLAVQSGGKWFAQKTPAAQGEEWNEQTLLLGDGSWHRLSSKSVTLGPKAQPNFQKVTAIGFAAPSQPKGSKDCIRLDWFEIHASTAEVKQPGAPLPAGAFLENETPFLRSALVIEGSDNVTRRGVLIPLGQGQWACFDPDLLRWSVVWIAPPGEAPLTYDSMASVSYPAAKAKASRPPYLRGTVLHESPLQPGIAAGRTLPADPRENHLTDGESAVGPLPRSYGQWRGITLSGRTPVLHYEVEGTAINEVLRLDDEGGLLRQIRVGPATKPLVLHVHEGAETLRGPGARWQNSRQGRILYLQPSSEERLITIGAASAPSQVDFPDSAPAEPVFPRTYTVENSSARQQGPFAVRNLTLPQENADQRTIRPVDLEFLSDGTALLITLDGDVWRIEGIENAESSWTRVATGLFETTNIEVDAEDRVYTLGRDQITELRDDNGDGHYDSFWNTSDLFLQTLMTRDYAMSFERGEDGAFYVAKGGLNNLKSGHNSEMSRHRGTILRIDPQADTAEVLADGLRLPYVGLDGAGAVYASDQQGHFIPSTPIHLISGSPYLGFEQTNFRARETPATPLVWFPYQANRSAAGFEVLGEDAFPDLAERFIHFSWNGRLFALETPDQAPAFAWQLPLQLDFPALNGAVHPQSGRLYVTGLGISGYKPTTPELMGLASIEQANRLPAPSTLAITPKAITLTFTRPLSPEETLLPAEPALRLFNIERTSSYGSGHFRWDGEPGEHQLQPSSFTLSSDRQSLELAFDSLHRSDILDLQLTYHDAETNETVALHLFAPTSHLAPASSADLASLKQNEEEAPSLQPGDARKGREVFISTGCIGCHSLQGERLTGPPLNGVGQKGEDYLLASILKPNEVITEGYEPAMPSFAGVIAPQDLADLVAYLSEL
ncbi:MAG: c-type cytochrome [Verrucomicrobiota bacterium JB023]|nr:c-type cytochrome [Verrucomicrobiota bacterium JB023]